MKLTYKINLLFTVIVSGILLLLAVIIFYVTRQNVYADFRDRLKARAERAAFFYYLFRNDTTSLLKSLDANAPPALFNKSIIIYNDRFQKLYEHHDDTVSVLVADTAWLRNAVSAGLSFIKKGEKDICVYQRPIPAGYILTMVAAENISGKTYINNLKRVFILYFPMAVLVTLIAGHMFSKNIIRPVKETIRDVQLITSQNLSHRLYTGNRKDELAELNATFNDLLNRLEESFAIQRRFISNASHELSTPLTSVSSQVEVTLLQNRSEEDYRRVLQSVLKDVQQMHQLTKTLLEIAKAGTHGSISLDKVRIDEILLMAHGELVKQLPGFLVNLAVDDLPEDENECMVFGNAILLRSAFKNIMENGCKYSPDNTTNVYLEFRGDSIEIRFQNKGDIIPEAEMKHLFEPFYRGSVAEGKQGVGLGLTLTRRIIGLHKGTLTVHSDQEGTTFKIILPSLKKKSAF
jgi:signal transduction histidine kinase